MTIEVPIPRATPVAIEAVTASLKKVPGHKSTVKNGTLLLEPDEADAIDAATREHARELLKENRAANSYRDVLLREVRKAIAAALGRPVKKATPTKKATAKKATPAKKASTSKATVKKPAKKAPAKAAAKKAPAQRKSARDRSEERAAAARAKAEQETKARAEIAAVKEWEKLPEADRGPKPETPNHDAMRAEYEAREAAASAAREARAREEVTSSLKAS